MSKENLNLSAYESYFEENRNKVSLNLLISEIKKTQKKVNDNYDLGINNEPSYDDIRQELLNNLVGTSDSASLEVEATPKIFKGKKDIIAINPIEANALSITFGIDFWTDLDSSLCTIKANGKKCKAILKVTTEISSPENFVAISKALAKKIDLKKKDQILLSNIRINKKRINLDKIKNHDPEDDLDY